MLRGTKIVTEILKAAKRGVTVRIIADGAKAILPYSRLDVLREQVRAVDVLNVVRNAIRFNHVIVCTNLLQHNITIRLSPKHQARSDASQMDAVRRRYQDERCRAHLLCIACTLPRYITHYARRVVQSDGPRAVGAQHRGPEPDVCGQAVGKVQGSVRVSLASIRSRKERRVKTRTA